MRLSKVSIGAIALPLLIAGCSGQDNPPQEAEGGNSSLENFTPRPPDSPILGDVSANGQCDPQILSMDREKIHHISSTTGSLVMP